MSTFKKLLALTLALAMVLSVSAFAGNYTDSTYADADKIDPDCEDAVELMYALDIMVGDGKNFNPESTVTRAEMAKMIYVVLNYGDDDKAANYTGAKIFSDVAAGAWYEGYVNYMATTKLVQGRPDGTFGPMDPVTCAEAAKMLLTAIGYSAEARGYIGAKWADNVLADAAIIGLLDGYKSNVNTFAPRQWVAVMMENALLNAYTYSTMYPSFSGLLTSGSNKDQYYPTMGQKYYDLKTASAYLYATEDAYIDVLGTSAEKTFEETYDKNYKFYAPDDCLLFSNGLMVESSKLGYMDLGQKFRVIYDSNDVDVVYSIRPVTSEVADAIQMDITVENTYATSSNDAKNKYLFTIDGMEAKFHSYTINALTVDYANGGKPGTINARALADDAGDLEADLYRAIDKDGDGDIDYMIIVPYTYAAVTKVGEHANYGEYFTALDVEGEAFKPTGYTGDKWYLDDVVNTDDEIVKGNYIKVNYNLDNGAYDVEVLDVAEAVTYEKRTSKGVHTLGGEEYQVAAKGFEAAAAEKVLVAGNLKEDMDVVYDGSLVVYAEVCDSNYADLSEINAQLVMVTEAYTDVYTGSGYSRNYIEYMTIDGELHEEVRYNDSKAADATYGVDFATLNGMLDNNYRLFALRESGDTVYLLDLYTDTDKDNSQKILDYSSSLLDGYKEIDPASIDTKDNEIGDDYIESENTFFVSYKKPNKSAIYFDVLTIDELNEGVTKDALGNADGLVQGLYTEKRSYDLYLAGHLYLGELDLYQATGYLYTTSGDIYEEDYYGYDILTDVYFNDGAAEGVEIAVDLADGQVIEANCLYAYTYDRVNGEKVYTLTLVDDRDTVSTDGVRIDVTYSQDSFSELVDKTAGSDIGSDYELVNVYVADDGDKLIVADHKEVGREKKVVSSSATIVLKNVVLDRNENQNGDTDDDLSFSIESEINFIDFDTLMANEGASELAYSIYNGDYDDTYNYYSDYRYVMDGDKVKMLYVITYAVEKEAQIDEEYHGEGVIENAYYMVLNEGARKQFTVTLNGLYFEDAVELRLYAGNELLTVAENTSKVAAETTYAEIDGAILITGTSSSWDVEEWTPSTSATPTRVELVVDDKVIDEAYINVFNFDTMYADEPLTAQVWADIVNGL